MKHETGGLHKSRLAIFKIGFSLPEMGKVRHFKVWTNHALTMALLSVVACSQAEVIPWPLAGLAVAKEGATRIVCVNNLKQIGYAAKRFSNDNGHFPSSFQELTNYLDNPKQILCPANGAHLPPASWADLDWNQVDYDLVPGADPANPSTQLCRCKIHDSFVTADTSVTTQPGYHSGWPAVIAHPLDQEATPGSTVQFEVKIVANALPPLSFQWRREHLYFVTNVTFTTDTNAPGGGFYQTNRQANFTVTPLPRETNTIYTIQNAPTNVTDYYSVAISNSLGIFVSQRARPLVLPIVATRATNDYWFAIRCQSNLKQIQLLAGTREIFYPGQAITNFSQMLNYDGSPMFEWPVQLYCPADNARTAPADWNNFDFSNTSYEILPHPSLDADPAAVFCRCKVHDYSASLDGSVSYTTNSPLFVGQLVDQTAVFGSDLVFRARALGLAPLNYTWYKDGQTVLTGTNGTLTLTNLARADAGVYSVSVSNSAGSVPSNSATLTAQIPQRLTNPQFLSGGVLRLMAGYADGWPVAPGELAGFEALVSSNLADWTTLVNSLSVSNGLLLLQDAASADQAGRFYRIIQH
jgi:hypothetical protein